MRWCRIEVDGRSVYGQVEGEDVVLVDGSPFDIWTRTPRRVPLGQAKLLVPVVPPNFYAAGLN